MTALLDDPEPTKTASPYPLFDFNRTVATADDLQTIFDSALVCIRDSLGVEKSSILLFDEAAFMRFRAWVGLSEEYRQAVEGHTPWTPATVDPQPVLVKDVRDEASLAPLLAAIEAEGIRSLAFFPLMADEKLLGKFMLYYPEPHTFTQEEIILSQTIAAHVGFAIDHFTLRMEWRETREHMEAMLNSTVLGIAELDASANFVMVSDRFCEIVGRTREELIGLTTLDITHAEDLDQTRIWLRALMDGATNYTVEKRYLKPDGSTVWVSINATAVHDDKGAFKSGMTVVTDVTERKQADAELAERNQLIQSMTDNMSVGLVVLDTDGAVEFMNPAAERLTGYSFDEARGRTAHELCHHVRPDGTPYPREDCPISQAHSKTQRLSGHEDIFVKPDGSLYNVVCNVAPLFRNGERAGAVLDVRDITIQKRAENALRESEESMREAAALKDQFLGLVSHELRTPISTILGNALLLKRRGEWLKPEDKEQSLEDIASEADKLQEIIENLLLLTRLEAGQIELEPLVLSQVVEESIADFRKLHPERAVDFKQARALPPAAGESTMVSLVLRNLLSNADKYSPNREPINVTLRENQDGALEVCVQDHGIGIDQQDLARAFDPFFRSTRSKNLAKGMGLGLAVCKRVVEAQGGSVWIESAPGEGSRFYFTLQTMLDPYC